MKGIRPPEGGRFRVVAAVAVALILLVGLVFPFIAVAYAERSVARTVSDSGEVTSSNPDDAPSTNGPDGHTTRKLPLLSDQAFAVWAEDPAAAIDTFSARVLPQGIESFDAIAGIAQAPLQWMESLEDFPVTGSMDLGVASTTARSALGANPREEDVLTLIAYLLLVRTDRSVDSNIPFPVSVSSTWLAAALAQEAAHHFGSCDSRLAYAHIMSLVPLSSTDRVDDLFDEASEVCGRDLTPRIAKAYYDLGFAAEGNGLNRCAIVETAISPYSWETVINQFEEIQSLAPSNPAGFVGEGDTYSVAAGVLAQWGVQPFTIRAFREAATEAYGRAQTLSAAPEVDVSLARVAFALGDKDEADRLLRELPDALSQSLEILNLRAQVLASQGRYTEAAQLSRSSHERTQESFGGIVANREVRGYSIGYDVQVLTGAGDDAQVDLLLDRQCGGDSIGQDRSFVPSHRIGYWEFRLPYDHALLAKEWDVVRDLCDESDLGDLCEISIAQGQVQELSGAASDYYQDLLRSVGDLDGAAAVAEEWVRTDPGSPTAHERLGEIKFMQERWTESAVESGEAVQLYTDPPQLTGGFIEVTGPFWAQLRQAVAEREAGQATSAEDLLQSLLGALAAVDRDEVGWDPALPMYVAQEIGLLEFDRGNYEAAVEHMEWSIRFGIAAEEGQDGAGTNPKVMRGVAAQVASAASSKLGRFDQARDFAEQAYDIDPYSPLFRETMAEAERNIDKGEAIASYERALAIDTTLFSTWNNLGVLLYQQGRREEARSAFEQAVNVKPDYAKGWFNLGVAESESAGIAHFLRSQGALGKAAMVDGTFRDLDRVVSFDEEIYDSGIDLSRPIPEDWQLAQTARSRPSLIGLGLILVVVLRIAWALGADWLTGRGIERAVNVEAHKHRKLRGILASRPSALWTTTVTLAALLFLAGVVGWAELLFAVALFSAILAAHALAPRLMSPDRSIRQTSFVPASLLTPGLALFGLGFTPPAPMADDDTEVPTATRRSGVAVLAALTVALGFAAWATGVPAARSGAVAALLLASSALIPVNPLDGARLSLGRRWEIGVACALGTATVLYAAGLI